MTTSAELLIDGFNRVRDEVHSVVDGLSTEQLVHRLGGSCNPIGWLVWHLTRVQDSHVADAAATSEQWTAQGWADRFGLPFERQVTGYGQPVEQTSEVDASTELLGGYHDAVHAATVAYVRGLSDADLNRVVDTRWDPPVTLGVRLVSVLSDDLQHVGQAAYVRGALEPS